MKKIIWLATIIYLSLSINAYALLVTQESFLETFFENHPEVIENISDENDRYLINLLRSARDLAVYNIHFEMQDDQARFLNDYLKKELRSLYLTELLKQQYPDIYERYNADRKGERLDKVNFQAWFNEYQLKLSSTSSKCQLCEDASHILHEVYDTTGNNYFNVDAFHKNLILVELVLGRLISAYTSFAYASYITPIDYAVLIFYLWQHDPEFNLEVKKPGGSLASDVLSLFLDLLNLLDAAENDGVVYQNEEDIPDYFKSSTFLDFYMDQVTCEARDDPLSGNSCFINVSPEDAEDLKGRLYDEIKLVLLGQLKAVDSGADNETNQRFRQDRLMAIGSALNNYLVKVSRSLLLPKASKILEGFLGKSLYSYLLSDPKIWPASTCVMAVYSKANPEDSVSQGDSNNPVPLYDYYQRYSSQCIALSKDVVFAPITYAAGDEIDRYSISFPFFENYIRENHPDLLKQVNGRVIFELKKFHGSSPNVKTKGWLSPVSGFPTYLWHPETGYTLKYRKGLMPFAYRVPHQNADVERIFLTTMRAHYPYIGLGMEIDKIIGSTESNPKYMEQYSYTGAPHVSGDNHLYKFIGGAGAYTTALAIYPKSKTVLLPVQSFVSFSTLEYLRRTYLRMKDDDRVDSWANRGGYLDQLENASEQITQFYEHNRRQFDGNDAYASVSPYKDIFETTSKNGITYAYWPFDAYYKSLNLSIVDNREQSELQATPTIGDNGSPILVPPGFGDLNRFLFTGMNTNLQSRLHLRPRLPDVGPGNSFFWRVNEQELSELDSDEKDKREQEQLEFILSAQSEIIPINFVHIEIARRLGWLLGTPLLEEKIKENDASISVYRFQEPVNNFKRLAALDLNYYPMLDSIVANGKLFLQSSTELNNFFSIDRYDDLGVDLLPNHSLGVRRIRRGIKKIALTTPYYKGEVVSKAISEMDWTRNDKSIFFHKDSGTEVLYIRMADSELNDTYYLEGGEIKRESEVSKFKVPYLKIPQPKEFNSDTDTTLRFHEDDYTRELVLQNEGDYLELRSESPMTRNRPHSIVFRGIAVPKQTLTSKALLDGLDKTVNKAAGNFVTLVNYRFIEHSAAGTANDERRVIQLKTQIKLLPPEKELAQQLVSGGLAAGLVMSAIYRFLAEQAMLPDLTDALDNRHLPLFTWPEGAFLFNNANNQAENSPANGLQDELKKLLRDYFGGEDALQAFNDLLEKIKKSGKKVITVQHRIDEQKQNKADSTPATIVGHVMYKREIDVSTMEGMLELLQEYFFWARRGKIVIEHRHSRPQFIAYTDLHGGGLQKSLRTINNVHLEGITDIPMGVVQVYFQSANHLSITQADPEADLNQEFEGIKKELSVYPDYRESDDVFPKITTTSSGDNYILEVSHESLEEPAYLVVRDHYGREYRAPGAIHLASGSAQHSLSIEQLRQHFGASQMLSLHLENSEGETLLSDWLNFRPPLLPDRALLDGADEDALYLWHQGSSDQAYVTTNTTELGQGIDLFSEGSDASDDPIHIVRNVSFTPAATNTAEPAQELCVQSAACTELEGSRVELASTWVAEFELSSVPNVLELAESEVIAGSEVHHDPLRFEDQWLLSTASRNEAGVLSEYVVGLRTRVLPSTGDRFNVHYAVVVSSPYAHHAAQHCSVYIAKEVRAEELSALDVWSRRLQLVMSLDASHVGHERLQFSIQDRSEVSPLTFTPCGIDLGQNEQRVHGTIDPRWPYFRFGALSRHSFAQPGAVRAHRQFKGTVFKLQAYAGYLNPEILSPHARHPALTVMPEGQSSGSFTDSGAYQVTTQVSLLAEALSVDLPAWQAEADWTLGYWWSRGEASSGQSLVSWRGVLPEASEPVFSADGDVVGVRSEVEIAVQASDWYQAHVGEGLEFGFYLENSGTETRYPLASRVDEGALYFSQPSPSFRSVFADALSHWFVNGIDVSGNSDASVVLEEGLVLKSAPLSLSQGLESADLEWPRLLIGVDNFLESGAHNKYFLAEVVLEGEVLAHSEVDMFGDFATENGLLVMEFDRPLSALQASRIQSSETGLQIRFYETDGGALKEPMMINTQGHQSWSVLWDLEVEFLPYVAQSVDELPVVDLRLSSGEWLSLELRPTFSGDVVTDAGWDLTGVLKLGDIELGRSALSIWPDRVYETDQGQWVAPFILRLTQAERDQLLASDFSHARVEWFYSKPGEGDLKALGEQTLLLSSSHALSLEQLKQQGPEGQLSSLRIDHLSVANRQGVVLSPWVFDLKIPMSDGRESSVLISPQLSDAWSYLGDWALSHASWLSYELPLQLRLGDWVSDASAPGALWMSLWVDDRLITESELIDTPESGTSYRVNVPLEASEAAVLSHAEAEGKRIAVRFFERGAGFADEKKVAGIDHYQPLSVINIIGRPGEVWSLDAEAPQPQSAAMLYERMEPVVDTLSEEAAIEHALYGTVAWVGGEASRPFYRLAQDFDEPRLGYNQAWERYQCTPDQENGCRSTTLTCISTVRVDQSNPSAPVQWERRQSDGSVHALPPNERKQALCEWGNREGGYRLTVTPILGVQIERYDASFTESFYSGSSDYKEISSDALVDVLTSDALEYGYTQFAVTVSDVADREDRSRVALYVNGQHWHTSELERLEIETLGRGAWGERSLHLLSDDREVGRAWSETEISEFYRGSMLAEDQALFRSEAPGGVYAHGEIAGDLVLQLAADAGQLSLEGELVRPDSSESDTYYLHFPELSGPLSWQRLEPGVDSHWQQVLPLSLLSALSRFSEVQLVRRMANASTHASGWGNELADAMLSTPESEVVLSSHQIEVPISEYQIESLSLGTPSYYSAAEVTGHVPLNIEWSEIPGFRGYGDRDLVVRLLDPDSGQVLSSQEVSGQALLGFALHVPFSLTGEVIELLKQGLKPQVQIYQRSWDGQLRAVLDGERRWISESLAVAPPVNLGGGVDELSLSSGPALFDGSGPVALSFELKHSTPTEANAFNVRLYIGDRLIHEELTITLMQEGESTLSEYQAHMYLNLATQSQLLDAYAAREEIRVEFFVDLPGGTVPLRGVDQESVVYRLSEQDFSLPTSDLTVDVILEEQNRLTVLKDTSGQYRLPLIWKAEAPFSALAPVQSRELSAELRLAGTLISRIEKSSQLASGYCGPSDPSRVCERYYGEFILDEAEYLSLQADPEQLLEVFYQEKVRSDHETRLFKVANSTVGEAIWRLDDPVESGSVHVFQNGIVLKESSTLRLSDDHVSTQVVLDFASDTGIEGAWALEVALYAGTERLGGSVHHFDSGLSGGVPFRFEASVHLDETQQRAYLDVLEQGKPSGLELSVVQDGLRHRVLSGWGLGQLEVDASQIQGWLRHPHKVRSQSVDTASSEYTAVMDFSREMRARKPEFTLGLEGDDQSAVEIEAWPGYQAKRLLQGWSLRWKRGGELHEWQNDIRFNLLREDADGKIVSRYWFAYNPGHLISNEALSHSLIEFDLLSEGELELRVNNQTIQRTPKDMALSAHRHDAHYQASLDLVRSEGEPSGLVDISDQLLDGQGTHLSPWVLQWGVPKAGEINFRIHYPGERDPDLKKGLWYRYQHGDQDLVNSTISLGISYGPECRFDLRVNDQHLDANVATRERRLCEQYRAYTTGSGLADLSAEVTGLTPVLLLDASGEALSRWHLSWKHMGTDALNFRIHDPLETDSELSKGRWYRYDYGDQDLSRVPVSLEVVYSRSGCVFELNVGGQLLTVNTASSHRELCYGTGERLTTGQVDLSAPPSALTDLDVHHVEGAGLSPWHLQWRQSSQGDGILFRVLNPLETDLEKKKGLWFIADDVPALSSVPLSLQVDYSVEGCDFELKVNEVSLPLTDGSRDSGRVLCRDQSF